MSRKKSKNKQGVSGNKKPLQLRRATARPQTSQRVGLPVDNAPPPIESLKQVNVNAAGIDIAANVHFVAVPKDRDAENQVRSFGAFTADLDAIADWLTECRIETVAMESTGVYWIPLFEVLERRGFEVILVEPSQVKKFRRKTDVLDSQWIQTLHTFGLLTGSFRPADRIIVLRSYMRQREMLVKSSAQHIQHMQKARLIRRKCARGMTSPEVRCIDKKAWTCHSSREVSEVFLRENAHVHHPVVSVLRHSWLPADSN